jgi:hypothetical protein
MLRAGRLRARSPRRSCELTLGPRLEALHGDDVEANRLELSRVGLITHPQQSKTGEAIRDIPR